MPAEGVFIPYGEMLDEQAEAEAEQARKARTRRRRKKAKAEAAKAAAAKAGESTDASVLLQQGAL